MHRPSRVSSNACECLLARFAPHRFGFPLSGPALTILTASLRSAIRSGSTFGLVQLLVTGVYRHYIVGRKCARSP